MTARKHPNQCRQHLTTLRAQYPHHWPRLTIAKTLGVSPAWLRKMERAGLFPPPAVVTARLKLWEITTVRGWAQTHILPQARKSAIGELLPASIDARPFDLPWWKRWNLECGTRLTRADARRISRKVQGPVATSAGTIPRMRGA